MPHSGRDVPQESYSETIAQILENYRDRDDRFYTTVCNVIQDSADDESTPAAEISAAITTTRQMMRDLGEILHKLHLAKEKHHTQGAP